MGEVETEAWRFDVVYFVGPRVNTCEVRESGVWW